MASELYAQISSGFSSVFGGGWYGGQQGELHFERMVDLEEMSGQYSYVPNSGYGTGYGSYSYPPRSASFVGPTTYVQTGGSMPQTGSFVRTQSFTGPPVGTYYQQPSYSGYSGQPTATRVTSFTAGPTTQTASYIPPVRIAPTTQTSSYIPPVSTTYIQGAPRTASFAQFPTQTSSYIPPIKTTTYSTGVSSYVPPVAITTRVPSFTTLPTATYGSYGAPYAAPSQFRYPQGLPPQQVHQRAPPGQPHPGLEHAQPYEPAHDYGFDRDVEAPRARRKKGICSGCC